MGQGGWGVDFLFKKPEKCWQKIIKTYNFRHNESVNVEIFTAEPD